MNYTWITWTCVLVLFIGTSEGSISVTSEPEKCAYSAVCTLSCHIEDMKETVMWVYNDVTYFLCSPPYGAGICSKKSVTNEEYYTFKVDTGNSVMNASIQVDKDTNDGNWTCFHGNEYSTIDIDSATGATVTPTVDRTTVEQGSKIQLTCTVISTLPVDVNITVENILQGKRILKEIQNNSSLKKFIEDSDAECGDTRLICTAWNGYGSVDTKSVDYNVKCPIRILEDIRNETIEVIVGASAFLKLYYLGYPKPTFSWYRRYLNSELKLNSYRVLPESSSQPVNSPPYIQLGIVNVQLADVGVYSIRIEAESRTQIVTFTLKIINNSSVIDTSVELQPQPDSQPLSVYAGVGIGIAATLITIVMVLGVLWFVFLRKKATDGDKELQQQQHENPGYTATGVKNGGDTQEDYDDLEQEVYEQV